MNLRSFLPLHRLSKAASVLLLGVLAFPAAAAEFYAAPSGSVAGDGSREKPWNIETAFAHPAAVKPGDLIWLRGGEYVTRSGFSATLKGNQSAPIMVRSHPGERAVLIGNQISGYNLQVTGMWTIYRDLELKSSLKTYPAESGGLGFHGNHNSLVNSVVHDTANNSLHGNGNAIYGCLFYFNGTDGSSLGHAIYVLNEDLHQPAVLEENIFFASYAFGIHAYAGGVGKLNGLHFVGNVAFINGAAQTVGDLKDNYLVGGVNGQQGVLFRENMSWSFTPNKRSVSLGRYSQNQNLDITLTNNYFVGTTLFYNQWQSIKMTGNTFYGPVTWGNSSMVSRFPNNTYLSAAPSQNKIFIRPNRYEEGRAHIIVYNWTSAETVMVDVSSVLPHNSAYEVRNTQDFFGPPVLTGVYAGGSITLPLSGLTMAKPLAGGLIEDSERTGKRFNVFVIRRVGSVGVL